MYTVLLSVIRPTAVRTSAVLVQSDRPIIPLFCFVLLHALSSNALDCLLSPFSGRSELKTKTNKKNTYATPTGFFVLSRTGSRAVLAALCTSPPTPRPIVTSPSPMTYATHSSTQSARVATVLWRALTFCRRDSILWRSAVTPRDHAGIRANPRHRGGTRGFHADTK